MVVAPEGAQPLQRFECVLVGTRFAVVRVEKSFRGPRWVGLSRYFPLRRRHAEGAVLVSNHGGKSSRPAGGQT